MPQETGVAALLTSTVGFVGSVLLGVGLRWVFGRLARRALGGDRAWGGLGWGLLSGLSLPVMVGVGVWWAGEVLRPGPPVAAILDRTLLAAVVLGVALAVARIAGNVVRRLALARLEVAGSASIFVNITRAVIVVIGGLVLLQTMGLSITPMLTALGVGGLAVALALQGTLANLFAGVQVLASRKVRPGDYIRLDSGEEGYVEDINWRNTTIRQLGGNIVVLPNARIGDTIVTNYQPGTDTSVLVRLGVSYASDLEQVERVTIDVARDVMTTVSGGVPSHEPFVRYREFGDSSVNFSVILRVEEYAGQYLVVHEFIKRLHRRYQSEGIEIPFPIRTLVMSGDPVGPVVPEQSSPQQTNPTPAMIAANSGKARLAP